MTTTVRRSRRLLAAASVLIAGGLAASALVPSGATPPSSEAVGVVLKAPQPAKGKAWIRGFVEDRAGRSPLGVVVEAFVPGTTTPVATSLTYAGLDRRGDEVDGFFWLVVPPGEYVLKYSSPSNARDPFRTVRDATSLVKVRGRDVRDVGTQTLTLQRKADVTVSAELESKKVRSTKRAEVTLDVTSKDVVPVTGDVEVTSGRRVFGEATLTRSDHGGVDVELPKLRPGTYRLVVSYLGNDYTAAGTSETLKLTVVRR